MIYFILIIAIAILLYFIYKQNQELKKLRPLEYDYNTLKDNYEELTVAYDTIYEKYYTIQEENLDLEKKIDELEERELTKEFKEKLNQAINEAEFCTDQEEK